MRVTCDYLELTQEMKFSRLCSTWSSTRRYIKVVSLNSIAADKELHMPLFGKKKDSKGDVSGGGYSKQQPYPTQQPAYPTQQPAYPTQPPAYPTQPPAQYGGPPPPYQPAPQQTVAQPQQPAVHYQHQGQPPVAQQQAPQPSGSGINNEDLAYLALASPYYGYGGGLVAAAALSGQEHRGSAPVCSVPQPQQTAAGQPPQGVFDQGARFGSNKPVNVPPPPPGVAPTAAQSAAAQGQTVVMSQQRKDSWGFGSDGGATFF